MPHMKMKQYMADDLNYVIARNGSLFKVFKSEGNDYAWEINVPKDPFEAHRPTVYPNKEFYDLLERHYGRFGFKLEYNNTKTTFWTNDR